MTTPTQEEKKVIKYFKFLVDRWGLDHEDVQDYFADEMWKKLRPEILAPFVDWDGQ